MNCNRVKWMECAGSSATSYRTTTVKARFLKSKPDLQWLMWWSFHRACHFLIHIVVANYFLSRLMLQIKSPQSWLVQVHNLILNTRNIPLGKYGHNFQTHLTPGSKKGKKPTASCVVSSLNSSLINTRVSYSSGWWCRFYSTTALNPHF